MKTCDLCGKEFDPVKAVQRFCSADCRIAEAHRRGREAMREKRGSFTPKPCADCKTEIIGKAKRCPECKKADDLRRQRENKAKAESLSRANELRRARKAADPVKAAEIERKRTMKKQDRLQSDPIARAALNDKRRAYVRAYAAKRRAEREAAILANLGGDQ